MKHTKKLVAVLLAMLLLFGTLPVVALADVSVNVNIDLNNDKCQQTAADVIQKIKDFFNRIWSALSEFFSGASAWTTNENEHWHKWLGFLKKGTGAHAYSETVIKTPTCLATGIKRLTCVVCGYSRDESIDIDPNAHSFSDTLTYSENTHWYPTTCGHDVKNAEAGHTMAYQSNKNGTHKAYCTGCGYSKTETCLSGDTCGRCGYVKPVVVPLDPNSDPTVITDPKTDAQKGKYVIYQLAQDTVISDDYAVSSSMATVTKTDYAIDLNGHDLTFKYTGSQTINSFRLVGTNLHIYNSSDEDAKIFVKDNNNTNKKFVLDGGEILVENVIFEGWNIGPIVNVERNDGYYFCNATFNDCEFISHNCTYDVGIYFNSTVNFNNCTFTGTPTGAYIAVGADGNNKVNVNGGTFSGKPVFAFAGYFYGSLENVSVSGTKLVATPTNEASTCSVLCKTGTYSFDPGNKADPSKYNVSTDGYTWVVTPK